MKTPNPDHQKLIADYDQSTGHCSFAHMMRKSEFYPTVMAHGNAIMPDILHYLEKKRGGMSIMLLLMDNVKDPKRFPYSPKVEDGFAKYTVRDAAKAWVEWGKVKYPDNQ